MAKLSLALMLALFGPSAAKAVQGDAQYPVVTIHVPEPALSATEQQLRAAREEEQLAEISELRSSLLAKSEEVLAKLASLRGDIEKRVAGSASALHVPQGGKTEEDVLSSLRSTCGNECLDLWKMAATSNSSEHGPLYGTLVSLATMAQRKIQAEAPEAHPSFAEHQEHPGSKLSAAAAHVAGTSDDTACESSASCQLKSLRANRCNYPREALQATYQGLNLAAHTLGSAVSVLCGCSFVSDKVACALQTVPQVCVFPYSVYSQAFAGSIEAWEAVKAATKSCMMHGDAATSS